MCTYIKVLVIVIRRLIKEEHLFFFLSTYIIMSCAELGINFFPALIHTFILFLFRVNKGR